MKLHILSDLHTAMPSSTPIGVPSRARPHAAALEVLLCKCSGGASRFNPGEVSLYSRTLLNCLREHGDDRVCGRRQAIRLRETSVVKHQPGVVHGYEASSYDKLAG